MVSEIQVKNEKNNKNEDVAFFISYKVRLNSPLKFRVLEYLNCTGLNELSINLQMELAKQNGTFKIRPHL